MKILKFGIYFILGSMMFMAFTPTTKPQIEIPLKIWFNLPASNWNEALPVGNGRDKKGFLHELAGLSPTPYSQLEGLSLLPLPEGKKEFESEEVFLFNLKEDLCEENNRINETIMENNFKKGSFGFDVQFFKNQKIETIELKEYASGARILIVPDYQGRVMTSSANGKEGKSFGWINHDYIQAGEINSKFNAFGGEERFWLGPEGGPSSIFFKKGDEQSFTNWWVPREIDTVPFDLMDKDDTSCSFQKDFKLVNASGTPLDIGVERSVQLLSKNETETALDVSIHNSLHTVAYETENTLINRGENAWTEENGFLSIWLLCMFNPSEKGVVFLPYREGSVEELGKIVEDDYFGKVPADRLIVKNGTVFFKVVICLLDSDFKDFVSMINRSKISSFS